MQNNYMASVRCDQCCKEMSWKIEDMPTESYELVIRTHKAPCEKCYHLDENKITLSFCSEKCLKDFVKGMK